nr:MAG: hypothetical protein [Molluscum contagiosum virus]
MCRQLTPPCACYTPADWTRSSAARANCWPSTTCSASSSKTRALAACRASRCLQRTTHPRRLPCSPFTLLTPACSWRSFSLGATATRIAASHILRRARNCPRSRLRCTRTSRTSTCCTTKWGTSAALACTTTRRCASPRRPAQGFAKSLARSPPSALPPRARLSRTCRHLSCPSSWSLLWTCPATPS